jgi:hypothetical protein
MHVLGGHEVLKNMVRHVHMFTYEDFFQNENQKNIHTKFKFLMVWLNFVDVSSKTLPLSWHRSPS